MEGVLLGKRLKQTNTFKFYFTENELLFFGALRLYMWASME